MQTLPACRVHPLQLDWECITTTHALIQTMLSPTVHCAVENGEAVDVQLKVGHPPWTSCFS